MNNTATNTAPCPTVRKQIGKTTYVVRVHFSETAKETMEDKIKRPLAPAAAGGPPNAQRSESAARAIRRWQSIILPLVI